MKNPSITVIWPVVLVLVSCDVFQPDVSFTSRRSSLFNFLEVSMKRMLLVLAVVMGMTASVSAEQIYFRGTAAATGIGSEFYNGRAWTMLVTYTPAVFGPAAVTAATLFFYSNDATDHKNESFNLIPAGANVAANEIGVTQNAGANNDSLTIQMEFGPSELGRGTASAFMDNLVVTGQTDVGNTNGTVANITALGAIGNSVAGTFRVSPRPGGPGSLQVNLTGFSAVPEPGSIALLSGLGLVVGRRLLKRRAKKQEAAV
jgi:hypothetical protein